MTKHRPARYAQVAADLRRDGFAVARACIDGSVLRDAVEEYETNILPHKHSCDVRREVHGPSGEDGLPRVVHVSNIYEVPVLAHIAANRHLLELASACLGEVGVRPIINAELFDKPPDGNMSTTTPPHQDNFYFKAQEPGIALWVALDEMNPESGTVQYVRGSHLRGLRYHEWDQGPAGFAKTIYDFTDEDEEMLGEVGHLHPGDVVVHSGLTIHYAPGNMTSRRRRGLVINYVAEHIAYTLTDDLHQPALDFHLGDTGLLTAAVPEGWPDRHVLAVTSVMCALTGWRGITGGVPSKVYVEEGSDKLVVDVADHLLRRQAIIALVKSGHVVRGAEALRSLPLRLGEFTVPLALETPRNKLPDTYLGTWILNCEESIPGAAIETSDLAVRLQTLSGIYVDVRIPRSMIKLRSLEYDTSDDPLSLAELSSSAGFLAMHGEFQDIAVHHHCMEFQPCNAMPDVRQVCWQEEKDHSILVETTLSGYSCYHKQTWVRVDEPLRHHNVAALELVDDPCGRRGFWVVVGSWFGRVIGRRSSDVLANVACRSLPHALKTYAEDWGLEEKAAVCDYEAALGRVEAPGILRVQHDFDASREGSLLLDNSTRQLRRDSNDSSILVETWCCSSSSSQQRRWRIRELPSSCAALGSLKRAIV
eukprot:TRINITY_DN31902_c0_g1_i1.p1 TRINITY_DN31902_c0_g1~~TRINITY_DN31902_c0_g1_i1.p1  ORF type:complete len:649 (+),score=80.51 TRINITY_DN31902_c0_g1_i1:63-2009(+)